MPSLYSQLVGALIPCPLEDHSLKSQYLPCNVLDDLITPESISAQLPLTDRLYSYLISDPLPSLVCQGAKKVFAILVFIGEPQAIRDLIDKDNITDADLPLCRKNSESGARDYNTVVSRAGHIIHSFASWKEARIRDFLVNQWVVQAPMLSELGKEVKIDPQCPLPLIPLHKKSPELHGSLGVVVHQGRFHPAHQLVSLTTEQNSLVAIKEIRDRDSFCTERDNLLKIQSLGNRHLIKLLCSWDKDPLYYLVFPWADGGDLQDLWSKGDHKPVTLGRLLWSLRQILGLTDAVGALHQQNIRHGDIKPQNILHFTNLQDSDPDGDGILVLADVGISKQHHQATDLRKDATNTSSSTIRYEAPEAASERTMEKPRPRRYDMWSLGCMFLEYTVWLLYGFDAVEVFRCRRMLSRSGGPKRESGNFFTERSRGAILKIHPRVSQAIELIRSDPRCPEGTALRDFVDVIEAHLLQIEPERRSKAPELCDKVRKIVEAAVDDPEGSYLRRPFESSHSTPIFFMRSTNHRPASISSRSSWSQGSSSSGRGSSSDLSIARSSANSVVSHGEAG